MRTLVLIFLSTFVAACVTRPPASDRMPIQAWSSELQKQEPYKYPFVVSYRSGSKVLVFVASNHSTHVESASFKTIREVVGREKFDLFVAEGFPRSYGINPQRKVEKALKDGAGGFFKGEEPNYTIVQAQKYGSPFIGGEPDEMEIVEAIEKRDYTRKDLLFFYLIRQIPQWRRQDELKDRSVARMAEEFLDLWSTRLSLPQRPTIEEFKDWYQKKMGQPFCSEAITSETSAPYETSSIFTQKISSEVGKIRDTFTVRTIVTEMEKYPRVLIVYGGSHWITQSKAWEGFLGKPKFEKLAGD